MSEWQEELWEFTGLVQSIVLNPMCDHCNHKVCPNLLAKAQEVHIGWQNKLYIVGSLDEFTLLLGLGGEGWINYEVNGDRFTLFYGATHLIHGELGSVTQDLDSLVVCIGPVVIYKMNRITPEIITLPELVTRSVVYLYTCVCVWWVDI